MSDSEGEFAETVYGAASLISRDELCSYFVGFTHSKRGFVAKSMDEARLQEFPTLHVLVKQRVEMKIAREIRKLAHLRCSFIVQPIESVHSTCPSVAATELHIGGNLVRWLQLTKFLNLSMLCTVVHRIFCGLSFLHQMGSPHGNLRASNVLFKTERPDSVAITLDTSIRAELRKICYPLPIQMEYCPPEQFDSILPLKIHTNVLLAGMRSDEELREVDQLLEPRKESDIWCAGVIAHKILTGTNPFNSNNHLARQSNQCGTKYELTHPILQTFSPLVVRQLQQILHPDPTQRATAEEVAKHDWIDDEVTLNDSRNLLYLLEYKYVSWELESNRFVQQTFKQLQHFNL